MQKMSILTFLLSLSSICFAPNINTTFIPIESQINVFKPLLHAVRYVESRGDNLALNITEQAVGAFQIRQCRIEHFNKLAGKNYKLQDMFDYDKAKEVFLFFAGRLKDPELIAKKWNGSGPMTELYWNKVKQLL
jgi:hypothetical protein